ncbi:TIGR03790 family protein [Chitinibacter bivalviorum]|uniref:TIGR03790 family protein n=1 Tax=Chitinibacter bivalviorum TaxID=2739434 RepID=A0A7H9BMT5_9NEIS|nr:TIGR03790 family protein [Chitinibacter bivalviorum]QLG89752.1 TIGR03790 family protein [Chitinibacter bivalviorum]
MRVFALACLILLATLSAHAATDKAELHYQLNAEQLGLIINKNDPLSVEIGEYYAKQRQLRPEQILSIELPTDRVWITEGELEKLNAQINQFFDGKTQALALAWAKPYRVNCLSMTYGVTIGYVEGVCANTGKPTPESPYFNHASTQPFTDLKIRPSMMLAAKDFASAKKLIDTGLQAWGNYPKGTAYFLSTSDKTRSARAPLFPPSQSIAKLPIKIETLTSDALRNKNDVIIYQTGLAKVEGLETLKFQPGALADHLTSFGGMLTDSSQMSSMKWLEAGATASYGTVSEPYNHQQKFPHPQVLLFHYINGATAVEAYWKSVAWPAQGVFIGDPLAAPYRNLSPFKK